MSDPSSPVTQAVDITGLDEPPADESGLVIMVPEAQHLVGDLRKAYDPSATMGVLAHITILFPWIPPDEITRSDMQIVSELAQSIDPFQASVERVAWFPGDVMYLVPEPAKKFLDVLGQFHAAFPDCPPYGGRYRSVVPHLTVTQGTPRSELAETERELTRQLPIVFPVAELSILRVNHSQGQCETITRVPLGDNTPRLQHPLL